MTDTPDRDRDKQAMDKRKQLIADIHQFLGDIDKVQAALEKFEERLTPPESSAGLPPLSSAISVKAAPADYLKELSDLLDRHGLIDEFRVDVLRPRMLKADDALETAKNLFHIPRRPAENEITRDNCPYPGFEAFSEKQAELFFGRKT